MQLTGTARTVEFAVPSTIGRFFGNDAFLFSIDSDVPVTLPSKIVSTYVPSRLECFLRIPNFDGKKIEIEGDFDEFDKIFNVRSLVVAESGLSVGGAKHWPFVPSLIALGLYLSFLFVEICLGATLTQAMPLFPTAGRSAASSSAPTLQKEFSCPEWADGSPMVVHGCTAQTGPDTNPHCERGCKTTIMLVAPDAASSAPGANKITRDQILYLLQNGLVYLCAIFCLLAIAVFISAYLSRVAVTSIAQGSDRFLRRFTEYRFPKV